ncbi:MAG: ChaN family lipoprotein [Magnetovibrionaceae bacterium]
MIKTLMSMVVGVMLGLGALLIAKPFTDRLAVGPAQATTGEAAASELGERCVPAGQWIRPSDGIPLDHASVLSDAAKRPIVLLGETHTNQEDHRWQLHTIAALHALKSNMVLAFESFPRRVQPVLDRWIRGELSEAEFLKATEWNDVWRYDPSGYLPLFYFARMHRLPMVAMNVDISLVRRVGREGWDSVPEDERLGLTRPAPAPLGYLDKLASVTAMKARHSGKEAEPVDYDDPDFRRFVDAQQVWDRAMAEAMAGVAKGGGDPLVVGIVGRGHLEYDHGIPNQLIDLGLPDSLVLLPWSEARSCRGFSGPRGEAVADAVFGTLPYQPAPEVERPRLGVFIEGLEGEDAPGILIRDVVDGSIAEAAGLMPGDVLIMAAGLDLAQPSDLTRLIGRQAPGTWLPLTLRRDGEAKDVVARFPPEVVQVGAKP